MEIGISRVYNVLIVLKWEPWTVNNFVRDIVISPSWELMCVSLNQYDCFMCSFIRKRGPGSDQIKGFTERTKMNDLNKM